MESSQPTENAINPSLIKGLASTNASIRSKALKSVLNWIPNQTLISDNDLKKLWKSLFYCMWHSDKSFNQLNLITRLSNLILVLSPELSISYFSHFVVTMRREWPGIDHLRLDKFYLLVRHFVKCMFSLMKKMKWDLVYLGKFVDVLEKDLFFYEGDDVGDDGKLKVKVSGLGNGVCYHVVSVFCDEIKGFLPLSVDVLNVLFRPFFGVLGRSDNRVLVGKVGSNVFDCLIKNGKELLEVKKLKEEVDEKSEIVLFGTVALTMGFSTRFYELGSSDGCVQSNRKIVFGLHEEFSRLEKEQVSIGVEIAVPEFVEDEDVAPDVIPVANEVSVTENGDTKGKKKNKDKKSKKKKKKINEVSESSNDTEMAIVEDKSEVEPKNDVNDDDFEMSEDVISNLQKQFEKIAAESGLEGDGASAMESPPVHSNGKVKKRKRSKLGNKSDNGSKDEDIEASANTDGKSVKRVRFAMKNNLVWKPQTPLPPQSVRIPPSSTPRGSALKKGVSPGPLRDSSQEAKKSKKKKVSPMKKAKKVKSLSPAVKHGKKVKPTSA